MSEQDIKQAAFQRGYTNADVAERFLQRDEMRRAGLNVAPLDLETEFPLLPVA